MHAACNLCLCVFGSKQLMYRFKITLHTEWGDASKKETLFSTPNKRKNCHAFRKTFGNWFILVQVKSKQSKNLCFDIFLLLLSVLFRYSIQLFNIFHVYVGLFYDRKKGIENNGKKAKPKSLNDIILGRWNQSIIFANFYLLSFHEIKERLTIIYVIVCVCIAKQKNTKIYCRFQTKTKWIVDDVAIDFRSSCSFFIKSAKRRNFSFLKTETHYGKQSYTELWFIIAVF